MIFSPGERTFAVCAIIAVGVAQLFRTGAEQVIGVAYLLAAGFWLLSTQMRSPTYWAAIAQFVVGIVLFSRGASALVVAQTGWSGALIIFATWCPIGLMFMRFGWIGGHGKGREVYGRVS